MYFYEVVEASNKEMVIQKFMEMCSDSPDIQYTEEASRNALNTLCEIKPRTSDDHTIFIEKTELNGEPFDAVFVLEKNNTERFGLEINSWADTLGYLVDEKGLSIYGNEAFTALVLWEITWFGFNEETIKDHVSSWEIG